MIKVFDLVYGPNVESNGLPSLPIQKQVDEILKDERYELADLVELESHWGHGSENYKLTVNINENPRELAPLFIHQSFCHELVRVAKLHTQELPKDIPEAMEVLTAIRVLEKLYPQLKQ